MKTTLFIASALSMALGAMVSPVQAQTTPDCLLAINQGVISPACAKMMGLGAPASQSPPDNGGLSLQQTLHYQPVTGSVGNASIVGLTLGLGLADATRAMKAYCKADPRLANSFLNTTYKGVGVKTQFYPQLLQCDVNGDQLEVHVSPPVMGSVVTAIKRSVSFPADASPRFAELSSDIRQKYGLTLPAMVRDSDSETTAYVTATGTMATNARFSYAQPMDSSSYDAPGEIAYLAVRASPVSSNPANVSMMFLTLEDLRAERAINAEVLKQLTASVDQKLANSHVKPAL